MEELLKALEPNIEVLKNRDGAPMIEVEYAITNIIRIYDELKMPKE